MEKQELVIVDQESNAIVQPAVSADEALKQFKAFSEIKERVLSSEDKQEISGNPYIRKTGWRKIKTIFNLSEEILLSRKEEFEIEGIKGFRWIYRVRIKAKNGAYADAEMACDTLEDFAWTNKDHTKRKPETALMAMAQTRAFNRAISDLVGGGEVTAEEMSEIEPIKNVTPKPIDPKNLICSKCKAQVTEKIFKYSVENMGKPLCFKCQEEARGKKNTKDAEPEEMIY